MSWLDSALGVVSTIGNICGALQSVPTGAVHFGHPGRYNDSLGDIVFFNDEAGGISVLNQSSSNRSIAITIPGNPLIETGPTGLIIKFAQSLSVSHAFAMAAQGGENDVQMALPPEEASDAKDEDPGVTASCSTQARLNTNNTVSVGAFFNASLSDRALTITAGAGFILTGLVLLNIKGSTGNLCRIIQAAKGPRAAGKDDSAYTYNIPLGIDISAGIASIEVCGTIENDPSYVSDTPFQVKNLGESEMGFLKSLIPLN